MSTSRLLYHLMKADFLERTRRYSFLLTLIFSIYAAYIFLPPNPSNYATLQMDGHRGIYNSAWVGTLVAIMTTTFLMLAGFYLTKNTIARDRQTGVGQIIAATPVSKIIYIMGKALSNFLVLSSMVGVMIVTAGFMQLLRGEETHIEILKLVMPFLYVTLPVMAIVSGLAVLFESVKFLRGGLGNVIFFFLWIFSLSAEMLDAENLLGYKVSLQSMTTAAAQAYPADKVDGKKMSLGFNIKNEGELWHLKTFEWNGIDWNASDISKRMLLFGVAFGSILAGSLAFDRFDSTVLQTKTFFKRRSKKRRSAKNDQEEELSPELSPAETRDDHSVHLSRLSGISDRSRFGRILFAEVKLVLKGLNRWWLFIALGLFIVGVSVPLEGSLQIVMPLTWIWPLMLWSKMGTRESHYRTDQLIFSTAHTLRRQFPAMWCAGVVIAIITGSGILLRLLIAGEWQHVAAWCVSALFIPTLALAMGVWSRGSKLFEIVYLIVWYLGPWSKLPVLDFMGSTDNAINAGVAVMYSIMTILFFGLALLGRRRQVMI